MPLHTTPTQQSLRVGLIGSGGISHVHVAGWQALGATITVYSRSNSRALADQYGLAVADSLDDLLAAVDVVGILTPSATHEELALAAIAANKILVCEKPLADSTAGALAIMRAAEQADVPVYPAHVVRYFPEYVHIKAQVDAGRVGNVTLVRLSRMDQAPAAGSWFFSEAAGGGIIRDQMIHDLDQARWLAGEVAQVYAVQSPATLDGVVPSIVEAHVVLTHVNGAISELQGVWGAEGLTFRTRVDVAGDSGMLSSQSPEDGSNELDLPNANDTQDYVPPLTHVESPYTSEIREFAAAFTGGSSPRVNIRDGVLAVALAETAMASVELGVAIEFNAARVFEIGEPFDRGQAGIRSVNNIEK